MAAFGMVFELQCRAVSRVLKKRPMCGAAMQQSLLPWHFVKAKPATTATYIWHQLYS